MNAIASLRALAAKARTVLPYAPLVIPGWNVAWWAAGYAHFRLTGDHRAKCAADAIREVLLAPLPQQAVVIARDAERAARARIDVARGRLAQRRWRRILTEIKTALDDVGIETTLAYPSRAGFVIVSTVSDAQVPAFQRIWAVMYATYAAEFQAAPILSITPAEHLGPQWARERGLDNWAEPLRARCECCGKDMPEGWQFGLAQIAAMRERLRTEPQTCKLCRGEIRPDAMQAAQ